MPSSRHDALPLAAISKPLPLAHRAVLIALTLGAALLASMNHISGSDAAPHEMAALPARVISPKETNAPQFRQSWVNPLGHTTAAHSSAICVLPGGDLLSVWYGGTREGAADVAIFTARLRNGSTTWDSPRQVVDRRTAEAELGRSVKKVGNAVIFPDRSGLIWMVYVSVSMGGWSGSALNVKTSRDEGRTWTASERLTLNPFLNVSSLVRNKPILTADGRIGLPVYHEFALKFPQMLWLTPGPGGTVLDYRIRNLSTQIGLIQPTLVPLDDDRMLMMLRDGSPERRLQTAYSDDNGWTWSNPQDCGLPNPDSAVDALRLRDGRILLVHNHAASGRENLRLSISSDDGRTWQPRAMIESTAKKEYSYPYLVEDQQGLIHLTYTWHRERIKHLEFNLAWLNAPATLVESLAQ